MSAILLGLIVLSDCIRLAQWDLNKMADRNEIDRFVESI